MPTANIGALYKEYRETRVIYVLRNPILRGFSARLFGVSRGKYDERGLDNAQVFKSLASPSVLEHGNYMENIDRWNSVTRGIGAADIKVLMYRDIIGNPRKFITQLA
jgi:hypothetical protein